MEDDRLALRPAQLIERARVRTRLAEQVAVEQRTLVGADDQRRRFRRGDRPGLGRRQPADIGRRGFAGQPRFVDPRAAPFVVDPETLE